MSKLKWLCTGSFIQESVHLRAINLQPFERKKSETLYLFPSMYYLKMKMCLESLVTSLKLWFYTHALIWNPWNTVFFVSELGSPSWMSYKNNYLKELCYFKTKQKKKEKWPKVETRKLVYCLFSLIHGENVIMAIYEMAHFVGVRPRETDDLTVALIPSMPLDSCLNRNGYFIIRCPCIWYWYLLSNLKGKFKILILPVSL